MKKSIFDISHQNEDLSAKITAGFERISEAFRVLLWEHAKSTGLSPIQIQILIFVKYHTLEQATVSHLANEFNVTKPTISDAVKVLSQKKLIKKTPSAVDKRAYFITLTSMGQKIITDAESFAQPIHNLINGLDITEQKQLYNHIQRFIQSLNHLGILSVQRMCYNCRFYRKTDRGHYCTLMDMSLEKNDIRIDCPEFQDGSERSQPFSNIR